MGDIRGKVIERLITSPCGRSNKRENIVLGQSKVKIFGILLLRPVGEVIRRKGFVLE